MRVGFRTAANIIFSQARQALSSKLLIVSFSVCPAPDRHGVQLLNVLKALAPRYTVDVLTLRAGTMPFQERFMKTRMLRVPVVGALPDQVDMFRRAIRRQLEGEEYDVVHLRSAWGGKAVLDGTSGRLVYEVARSTEGEPRAADAALAHALSVEEHSCLDKADLILAPTETARAALAQRGLGARVEVVPPGVDVDQFDWEPPASTDAVPRVLYAGRIAGGRGIRTLIPALAMVRRRRPVKLVLAGAIDESFAPALDAALAAAGLGDADVERLGAIDHDDMPRVIAQATVCVAPAAPDSERPLASFPTKLLEYMACRRAVIAPRRPAVEEVVSDGEDGLLFAPGDEMDLARVLGRLLDDGVLRERIAETGYERVRVRHPASATRRRLLEAYARLLPPSSWAPPAAAVSPIDALPSRPDTTTARRPMPDTVPLDGRAVGEKSGEIRIEHVAPAIAVLPGEIVIEIDAPPSHGDDLLRDALEEAFRDDAGPDQLVAVAKPLGFDDDEVADEKTEQRPLHPKNTSR
ncbi:MAG: glycosyl transferase group 1 [Myxococcales bacterium]|nr:glycosyl transferase group 1 [Myxococcales bacterium]